MTIQKAGITCSWAPPMGRKMSSPLNIPTKPSQRGRSPTRSALSIVVIIPAASARPASRSR